MTYILAMTSAPESYDGFGTFTVREIGPNEFKPNDMDRIVMIQEGMLEWQKNRNASGLYATFTEVEESYYLDDYTTSAVCNVLFSKMSGLGN